MSKDDNYVGIALEDIRDQNKAVLEAVGQLQEKVNTLSSKDDLKRLEVKVDTIQAAITDTNKDFANLKTRVSTLDASN